MDGDSCRFSIAGEKYLDKHQVLVYVKDVTTQLLDHIDDVPKINTTKFLRDYFVSVKEGSHVVFREYNFVRATPHNRVSFVNIFWQAFKNIAHKGDLLSVREYHSLLSLLCPDFPFEPVQKTARIVLMEDAMDCLISFSDFLYAFQIQFCYDDFLCTCSEKYDELKHKPATVSEPVVVVPRSDDSPEPEGYDVTQLPGDTRDGVDAMQYLRALIPLCEELDNNAPPVAILKEILPAVERVTFYGFLMALAKSESLNKSLGQLPEKASLLKSANQDSVTHHGRSSASSARFSLTSLQARPLANPTTMALQAHPPPNPTVVSTLTTNSSSPEQRPQKTHSAKIKRKVPRATAVMSRKRSQKSSDSDDDDSSDSGSSTN